MFCVNTWCGAGIRRVSGIRRRTGGPAYFVARARLTRGDAGGRARLPARFLSPPARLYRWWRHILLRLCRPSCYALPGRSYILYALSPLAEERALSAWVPCLHFRHRGVSDMPYYSSPLAILRNAQDDASGGALTQRAALALRFEVLAFSFPSITLCVDYS